MQASIYYCVGNHRDESFAKNIYDKTFFSRDEEPINITVTKDDVEKFWVKMPITETLVVDDIDRALNHLFAKYNTYSNNPYSDENDEGQTMLRSSGAHHTSMSVNDLICIDNTYYIVKNHGFEAITITDDSPAESIIEQLGIVAVK